MKQTNILKSFLLFTLCTFSYATENHLELSFVQTSGNTDSTTVSGKIETNKYITPIDIIKAKGSILYSKNDGDTSANKYTLELDYNHMLNENLYAYLGSSYINDELSDYDYRLSIGPGFGYKFLNDDTHKLDVEVGVDYAYDNYAYASNEWYLAGKTELNYSYNIQSNIKFQQMLSYLFSLKEIGRYFVASESSFAVKMIENLSLAVTYRLDYTNETTQEKLDKKLLTSIIYDF
jgi:putative salt-induced outer membrane protein